MSDRPPLAELAARLLARQEVPRGREDRARMIAAAEKALRARARKRIVRRALVGAAAVAALALLALVRLRPHGAASSTQAVAPVASASSVTTTVHTAFVHMLDGDVVAIQGGQKVSSTTAEVPVGPGDRVVAAGNGRATMTLSTGTHFLIEPATDLGIVQQGPTQLFELAKGAVRLDVAKLHPGERFVLRTGEIEVEVRGTSFRVATSEPDPKCEGGLSPRVVVYEGEVVVREGATEAHVSAGQTWSRCTRTVTAAASAAPSASSAPSQAPAPKSSAPLTPPKTKPSLGEQNAAFAAAVDAKQRGDLTAAVAGFEQFRTRYPQSVLAEAAMVEEMKILAKTDKARAAIVARQYLAAYPKGFAADDARAIAAAP